VYSPNASMYEGTWDEQVGEKLRLSGGIMGGI
jgi:hypothetical protein